MPPAGVGAGPAAASGWQLGIGALARGAAGKMTEKHSACNAASRRQGSPRIWVLASYRAGENSQLSGLAGRLAERLDSAPRMVRLGYSRLANPLALCRRVSLAGLDAESRAALDREPPDLLLSAGFRNEPVVRALARRSGGRTRTVMIGRTWAPRRVFDLLVTTPQYRVPAEPWVLENLLTQHAISAERLAAVAPDPRFAGLPRPHLVVLLGGSSGPYALGPANAATLARSLERLQRAQGGSLLLTSSARTPPAFLRALRRALPEAGFCYEFQPGDAANPYLALLATADLVVVTEDSVAMTSEAAATGKPVLIAPMLDGGDGDLRARAYRALMRFGHPRLSRDVRGFHHRFVDAGCGDWLDSGRLLCSDRARVEAEETLRRVLALLPDQPPATAALADGSRTA